MTSTSRTWYDTALVCLNGHEINRCSVPSPAFNSEHCVKCGAKGIQQCPACSQPIRGYLHMPHVVDLCGYEVPAYCHACGRPYPWTQARLTAARELADEIDGLTSDERESLKKSIDDLVTDTPQTTVAATRSKGSRQRAVASRSMDLRRSSST